MCRRTKPPRDSYPIAQWRLRVGNLREYYDVEASTQHVVVKAVGVKERNRVRIGRVEFEL